MVGSLDGLLRRQQQDAAAAADRTAQLHKRAKLEDEFKSRTQEDYAQRRVLQQLTTALTLLDTTTTTTAALRPLPAAPPVPVPQILHQYRIKQQEEEEEEEATVGSNALRAWLVNAWPAPQRTLQLTQLAAYIRGTCAYCIYCGAQYASWEELSALCPGPTEAAHD